MKKSITLIQCAVVKVVCYCLLLASLPAARANSTFIIGETNFLLNGQPFQIKAGEMHPARIPHQYWADRLRMAHAMGLNTISVYTFWNQFEPREGVFDFTGDNDVAEFVRLAQAEGLYVILRPGPYVCAEWEFGGYPWWLLKQHDLKVRSQDPRFLAAAEIYLKKLGGLLAPLQITHGGPIILIQVENEYGSYGADHAYTAKIRDLERVAGFDVPQFTADGGGSMMAGGHVPDTLPGLNGGGGPDIMKEIGKYRPHGPWLVPEFYPGWLDHWGEPHAQTGIGDLVRETEWKLTNNVSFCYYMVYGGTSFGFMNGANYGDNFQPQPTSYDYDAPIDEAGRPTKKFFALRGVLAKYLAPGETLPDVPATTPIIAVPNIQLTDFAGLFDNLGQPVHSEEPLSFEDLDQGYGYVLYRTQIVGPTNALLKIKQLRDYATVYVDGQRVAILDRRYHQDSTMLNLTNASATLDILVENGGRINYGHKLTDNRKGITQSVSLGDSELTGWDMYKFPFDGSNAFDSLNFHSLPGDSANAADNNLPAVYRGSFDLTETGNTFLDMRAWGKGIVYVNGHNLGRYWFIGPQQTLYCPGCWLQEGRNEIVVFEQLKGGVHPLSGITTPILDQLNPDPTEPPQIVAAAANPRTPPDRSQLKAPDLQPSDLIKVGTLADSDDAQDITFVPVRARYLCLQALSSQNGDEFTTLGELDVLDAAGKTVSHKGWRVAYVDSEETSGDFAPAENAFDGDENTFWHTAWSTTQPPHPHTLEIDLGNTREISGLRLLPRQDSPNGRIKDYRLYLRTEPFSTSTVK
jgi:beta-galactosidase